MYLVGVDHPNKDRGNDRLRQFAAQREPLVTSVEVYQEILHRYATTRHRQAINDAFDALDRIVDAVLTFGVAEVRAAKEIVYEIRELSARDALHLAVMNSVGISRIFSFDRGFDSYPGIERLG